MKRKLLSILLIISILGLSSCSLVGDILTGILNPDSSESSHTSGDTKDTVDTEETTEQTAATAKETIETIKYKFELKSDITELLANGTTNLVTFTVSVSEEVQSITLTENNSIPEM